MLVTGADSGFGLATVLRLAELGFDTVGLVRPDPADVAALGHAAADRRVAVRIVEADLADPGQRGRAVDGLDVWALVNNAGFMNAGRLRDVPLEDGRRQLEVMVVAPLDLTRRLLPGMQARGAGRIVNVTTAAVHTSTPLTGWYAASKAALRELNDALRVELRGTGVTVTDVEPGGHRTGIWAGAAHELGERRARAAGGLYDRVVGRLDRYYALMASPDRVADAVVGALLAEHAPRHRRVGPDATVMRLAAELLPDAVWDPLVSRLAEAM